MTTAQGTAHTRRSKHIPALTCAGEHGVHPAAAIIGSNAGAAADILALLLRRYHMINKLD